MNINQLFEQFVGGGTASETPQGKQSAQQNGSGGVADILGKLTNGPAGGLIGGLAAGGLLGTLMGNKKMRKKAAKIAGGAVGYGGSAVLGAVALKAYQNWQSKKTAPQQDHNTPTLPSPESFDPALNQDSTCQPMQLALVKSMIAAANADGHIDSEEQATVFEVVDKMSLDGEAKAAIFDVLRNPPCIAEIASYATGLEQASEIYLASRLAIDPDQPSELRYLGDLSKALGLPDDLAHEIEMQLEPETPSPLKPKRVVGQFGRDASGSRVASTMDWK